MNYMHDSLEWPRVAWSGLVCMYYMYMTNTGCVLASSRYAYLHDNISMIIRRVTNGGTW